MRTLLLGRAYATASQLRATEAQKHVPGLKKQWRRSGKIHSRRKHDLTDGQIRPVDQPFLLGTGAVIEGQEGGGIRIMHPHDPKAPPSETINCGCISLPYMDEWAEAGLLEHPGKKPFSAEEIALNPTKAELNDPGPTIAELQAKRDAATLEAPKARRVVRDTEKSLRLGVNERCVVIGPRGDILLDKEGEPESIRFTPDELALMRDAVVTHTHPGIASFSPADIGLAATHGLAEIRVVDRVFAYSMRPPKDGWNQTWFENIAMPALERHMERIEKEFQKALDDGHIDQRQFDQNIWDEAWRRVAHETGLSYRRRKKST